jgi:hypothetical protein
MAPWLIGIAAAVLFVLAILAGRQIFRHARTDEGRLTILKFSFWLLAFSSCVYFWALVAVWATGQHPRSVPSVLIPFVAMICATIGMGISIGALREKIAFAKLPSPDESIRLEFQSRQLRHTKMAARVMLLFALLQFEDAALNYFSHLRTDADLAYKQFLIDSREDAVKHSIAKIRSAIELKSESPAAIRHSLADAQQSLDGLKQFAQR